MQHPKFFCTVGATLTGAAPTVQLKMAQEIIYKWFAPMVQLLIIMGVKNGKRLLDTVLPTKVRHMLRLDFVEQSIVARILTKINQDTCGLIKTNYTFPGKGCFHDPL